MSTQIIAFIQDEILNNKNAELTKEEDLLSTGILDSLSIMKLVQFIENQFEVSIPPEDMTIENFISVEAMEDYVTTLQPISVSV